MPCVVAHVVIQPLAHHKNAQGFRPGIDDRVAQTARPVANEVAGCDGVIFVANRRRASASQDKDRLILMIVHVVFGGLITRRDFNDMDAKPRQPRRIAERLVDPFGVGIAEVDLGQAFHRFNLGGFHQVGVGHGLVSFDLNDQTARRDTKGKDGDAMTPDTIIDLGAYPLADARFQEQCRQALSTDGVLVLQNFIQADALAAMQAEAEAGESQAYFCAQTHSVYLTPPDPALSDDHPANRQVTSSKGCICDDIVAPESPLRTLYDDAQFRAFVMAVTGEAELHPYADSLSSINIHYARRGQELGWHFDNSSFAITLLIEKPNAGSRFEYIKDLRDAAAGEMNYAGVQALLDGDVQPDVLAMEPGALVLFRGRNSIHRVSPNESDKTRMLAVLAYNAEPGVELSESARMTFYGRLNEEVTTC